MWEPRLLEKRLLFLPGMPSVGKTTLLLSIVEDLKAKGFSVGGMISHETRSSGVRVGFEIVDLNSGRRGWLAHVNQRVGPQVGKYHVNIEDLEGVGVSAVLKAVESCDVVAIDEVGPMELFSSRFRDAVKRAVESGKLVVGVVHWKAKDNLIDTIKAREDTEIIVVTEKNRNNLSQTITEKASELLTYKEK